MTATETKVKNVIEPIITNLGYRIYDVIYEKEGKDFYLRIFIDNDAGININDCETVNNAITDVLDEKDIIKNQYMLEVSSPGLERRIRSDEHLRQNLNKEIRVHTFKSSKSENTINGILVGYNDDSITIKSNNDEYNIKKENISKMETIFNWEEK